MFLLKKREKERNKTRTPFFGLQFFNKMVKWNEKIFYSYKVLTNCEKK
jgi:hypothetical protein